MYVKLYNRILYSSLANNRSLRHFFTDLLLCADPDGNVIMTREAIANTIRADLDEVDWGLAELQKADPSSLSPDFEGKRIIPLEGHGYGWKIVNYQEYRDTKTAADLREATAERVRRHREKKAREKAEGNVAPSAVLVNRPVSRRRKNNGKPLSGEQTYEKILASEGQEAADKFAESMNTGKYRPEPSVEIPKGVLLTGQVVSAGDERGQAQLPSPLDLPDAEIPEL